MKYTRKDLERNYDIIESFCIKYRRELTAFGAFAAEDGGLMDHKEYIDFMDNLGINSFVGNYLMMLMQDEAIDLYKKVLDGADFYETFVNFYEPVIYGDLIDRVRRYLED